VKYAVVESMTRIRLAKGAVRVWRDQGSLENFDTWDNDDLRRAIRRNMTTREIVEALTALPRVAAIEVLDDDGNGVVIYPEWP
jgi:hypothetical protein